MSLHDERRSHKDVQEPIKVTDRRRFTAQGHIRADGPSLDAPPRAETVQLPPPATPEPVTQQAPPKAETGAEQAPDEAPDGVDFLSFVASLATNAMAALGMLPEHERQGMPRSPEIAREYIDIIAMLERRTRGNVSAQEAQALKQLLGDLRRGYVEASRSVKPAQMPPEMMGALR